MDTDLLEQAVMEIVTQKNYKPVKPRAIAKRLGVDRESLRDVKKAVKRLIRTGKLVYGPDHLIELPSADDLNRISGIFKRTQGGFGFVRPLALENKTRDQPADIYISAKNCADASTGDLVAIRLVKGRRRGPNLEGAIVEVLERETHQFVGTYFESAGGAYVNVDGNTFAQPIAVGDPGTRNAQPGDKVVIDIVRFPHYGQSGEAVLTKVIGQHGEAGVETEAIIYEFNLPQEFPEDVLDDAQSQASAFDESIPDDRTDLTEETIITIDPVDARDFDDAISLVRNEKGHWLLGVHIADVAHFVKPRTALDREARNRATSVYLPDKVIPMLPEMISNSVASLQPDRVRYTKTVFIEFSPDGIPVHAEPVRSAIRSKRRFTYEEVNDYLEDRSRWTKKLDADVHRLLGDMHELAMILRKRRFQRGALELTMQEVKVDLDKHGRVSGAHLVVNTESHQVIEEFMLAANEAVASFLFDKDILFLRRVHASPDERKLSQLNQFVSELGIETESLVSRFALQKLLKAVHGEPEEHAVNYALLRSLQRAVYSPEEEGHYALASDCYCHFTSPIRRYPDLTVHRLLDDLFDGRKIANDFDHLAVEGQHCSDREERAEAAERQLTKVKLLHYMQDRIGEEMDAIVTGVEEYGLFVQGVDIPAEGLIHVTSLQDDYYIFDRTTHTLCGRRSDSVFRLGDRVRIAAARVDLDRRELDFKLVGRGPKTERSSNRAAASGKSGRKHTAKRNGTRGKQKIHADGRGKKKRNKDKGKRRRS
ncbi:MAG: ribonuclease R [Pirellulales bacterium]|nr:ribonuclease R [Pirellulales bacterium]